VKRIFADFIAKFGDNQIRKAEEMFLNVGLTIKPKPTPIVVAAENAAACLMNALTEESSHLFRTVLRAEVVWTASTAPVAHARQKETFAVS
jgi:hypothetical protein